MKASPATGNSAVAPLIKYIKEFDGDGDGKLASEDFYKIYTKKYYDDAKCTILKELDTDYKEKVFGCSTQTFCWDADAKKYSNDICGDWESCAKLVDEVGGDELALCTPS